jgi:hypothetical protein
MTMLPSWRGETPPVIRPGLLHGVQLHRADDLAPVPDQGELRPTARPRLDLVDELIPRRDLDPVDGQYLVTLLHAGFVGGRSRVHGANPGVKP